MAARPLLGGFGAGDLGSGGDVELYFGCWCLGEGRALCVLRAGGFRGAAVVWVWVCLLGKLLSECCCGIMELPCADRLASCHPQFPWANVLTNHPFQSPEVDAAAGTPDDAIKAGPGLCWKCVVGAPPSTKVQFLLKMTVQPKWPGLPGW
ncbi:uncharacterized protein K452DRAFT_96778 [Aplosporella prunicola CBS 121167]|uniref:Uncharacterized protein n=1 Tax=Aplosporella prunicola CBS 121167 TaxID=1176127 RepID=A0A6A6B4K2_9PEZI|nr:uncharacterized protein K452DRAFT_96778 [Aplosporella prunicola CBS 121167]KAF2137897.1 hypothetical protein K452DRAFT_96778 [Aplosporella prunicola CBS 121167]